MLNLRQLAAADMVLHGPRLVVTEFAAGLLLPAVLGLLSLFWRRGGLHTVFGVYLLLLALNYLPLLVFSLRIGTRERAVREAADLLQDRPALIRLSRQSLLLVIPILPLVFLMLALLQKDPAARE